MLVRLQSVHLEELCLRAGASSGHQEPVKLFWSVSFLEMIWALISPWECCPRSHSWPQLVIFLCFAGDSFFPSLHEFFLRFSLGEAFKFPS